MANITVSSNSSTVNNMLTVKFTTNAQNIKDILISKDEGSSYISATSFDNTSATFDVSGWDNGAYECMLKCMYYYPIAITIQSDIKCDQGREFAITYSTNVPATKHEFSLDGVNYWEIWPTSNENEYNNTYTFIHEAINDTTWNPVQRWFRVTDSGGNTSVGTITVTIEKAISTTNLLEGISLVNAYIDNADGGVKTEWAETNVGSIQEYIPIISGKTYRFNATGSFTEFRCAWYTSDKTYINCSEIYGKNPPFDVVAPDNAAYLRIHVATSTSYTDISNLSLVTISAGSKVVDAQVLLAMNYASAHEALPNTSADDVWKDRPRDGRMSTIPTQNCPDCASGTHTGNYQAGSLWSAFGQWATIYKIKDTDLVENVGVEITDFKMWRYNTSTNKWVLVNEGFDYGAFYNEAFWDDGSAPLDDHKILSSDRKTYKCLMDSQTSGRCFHPFSPQINWANVGFSDNTNPCYVVSQAKVRLIKWDENGADNRASANLCANVGGDYWIYKGAQFDNQWRHNGDIRIGYFKKLTNDWQYVYMTSCPKNWDKGFPCNTL